MLMLYGRSVPKTEEVWQALVTHTKNRLLRTTKQKLSGVLLLLGFIAHSAAVLNHSLSTKQLRALRDSGVPILICVGTRDTLVRAANSFYLRSVLDAQLHVFQGEGHGLIGEVKHKFLAILLNHIRTTQQGNVYPAPAKFFHRSEIVPRTQSQLAFHHFGRRVTLFWCAHLIFLVYLWGCIRIWLRWRAKQRRLGTYATGLATSSGFLSPQTKRMLSWPVLALCRRCSFLHFFNKTV